MSFEWNAHRFSGGVLALDLVNTVVYRDDPERAVDRFSDAGEIARFAVAARHFRSSELGEAGLLAHEGMEAARRVLDLREATNALLRTSVREGGARADHLAHFLRQGAAILDGLPAHSRPIRLREGAGPQGIPLEAAAFLSALGLLEAGRLQRIKICPNCHWLYLDESRNRSRRWCDMKVCGNRQKAKRHYHRSKGEQGHVDAS
jgi:predicted RNA-binding Zn ribbon-like protein